MSASSAREEALEAALTKIATWMEKQADRDSSAAKATRFETLKHAYTADAKNYRAMAKDARAALSRTAKER